MGNNFNYPLQIMAKKDEPPKFIHFFEERMFAKSE